MMDDETQRSWEYVLASPRSGLGVASMVGYRAVDVPATVHRGMPSATLTFIVSLDDGVQAADTAHALAAARPNPLILGGLHLRASHVQQRSGQSGVQLAVHPLASRALFGVPAAELPVTGYHALDVLGRPADMLPERAAAARDWPQVFAAITEYLVDNKRRRDDVTVRPELRYAWQLLERTRGRMTVGALADRVGVSSRHLTTLFRREVGRSPKTVSMLMRFHYATAAIAASARRHGRVDLAAVATEAGYCDQAHLTREFVRFAGVSPRAWLAEEFRNIQDGGHSFGSQCEHDYLESDCLVDTAGA